MIFVAAFLLVVVVLLGWLLILALKKLNRFEAVFEEIDRFSSEIHGYTSKFEGKALLSDAPEAVHLHRLITECRRFFGSFQVEERDDG